VISARNKRIDILDLTDLNIENARTFSEDSDCAIELLENNSISMIYNSLRTNETAISLPGRMLFG
jgi:hypothetical protein